jgi:hypothetical protein
VSPVGQRGSTQRNGAGVAGGSDHSGGETTYGAAGAARPRPESPTRSAHLGMCHDCGRPVTLTRSYWQCGCAAWSFNGHVSAARTRQHFNAMLQFLDELYVYGCFHAQASRAIVLYVRPPAKALQRPAAASTGQTVAAATTIAATGSEATLSAATNGGTTRGGDALATSAMAWERGKGASRPSPLQLVKQWSCDMDVATGAILAGLTPGTAAHTYGRLKGRLDASDSQATPTRLGGAGGASSNGGSPTSATAPQAAAAHVRAAPDAAGVGFASSERQHVPRSGYGSSGLVFKPAPHTLCRGQAYLLD